MASPSKPWWQYLPAEVGVDATEPSAQQGAAVRNEQVQGRRAEEDPQQNVDRGALAAPVDLVVGKGRQGAQGTPEPSFLQRLRATAPAQYLQRLDKEVRALPGALASKPLETLKELGRGTVQGAENLARRFNQVTTFGTADELEGLTGAAIEQAKQAVGLRPPSGEPFGTTYRRERGAARARDERAAQDPAANIAGTVGGVVVNPLSRAYAAAGTGGRVALGVGEVAATAAGSSDAELTGDDKDIRAFLKDLGIGTVLGAATMGALGVGAGIAARLKAGESAERAYAKQVSHDIGEGATALQQRQAIPDEGVAKMVVDLVERRPDLKKAIRGDKRVLAEKADGVVKELARQTAPIYQQFDEIAGQIPARDMLLHVKGEVDQLAQQTGTTAMRNALADVADDIVEVTKARAGARGETGPQFGGAKNWTHREARDWVSQLLEREQKTMGQLNATERADIVNALHDSADRFLRERFDAAAAANPQLQQAWDTLRPLNRDISAAIRVRDLAKAVDKREFQARGKGLERVAQATTAAGTGLIGAVAGGGDAGVAGALVGGAAGIVAPAVVKGLDRWATQKFAQMARASRAGKPISQMAEDLIERGVPQRVVRGFQHALEQNRAAEKRNKEKTK